MKDKKYGLIKIMQNTEDNFEYTHIIFCKDNQVSCFIMNQDEAVNLTIEKLMNYENEEEKNLLIHLPCGIGSIVYEVQDIRMRIQPLEIRKIHIGVNNDIYFEWKLKGRGGVYQNISGFHISELGKNVFLTKEEAEEKLKEIKKRKL